MEVCHDAACGGCDKAHAAGHAGLCGSGAAAGSGPAGGDGGGGGGGGDGGARTSPWEVLEFSAGNPRADTIRGKMHLYRDMHEPTPTISGNDNDAHILPGGRNEMLCVLAVPSSLSVAVGTRQQFPTSVIHSSFLSEVAAYDVLSNEASSICQALPGGLLPVCRRARLEGGRDAHGQKRRERRRRRRRQLIYPGLGRRHVQRHSSL